MQYFMKNLSYLSLGISALVLAAPVSDLHGATPILPGDLVLYRVGDGSAALSASATAVFLDEYTPLRVMVQSIPLPTTRATALTAVGNSSTEGTVSLSQNGLSFIYTGYRENAGGATPSSQTYTATP